MVGGFTVPLQAFTGNPLDRSVIAEIQEGLSSENGSLQRKYLPVAGRRIFTTDAANGERIEWFTADDLRDLDIEACDRYLMGKSTDGSMYYALDVSALGDDAAASLARVRPGVTPCELRSALMTIPTTDSAMAGQAVALSQWHQAHRFCPQCGNPTQPVQGGTRRQCTATASHRQYPRTDPVVIMLVESVDGSKALLGRSKKIRAGMMTTLAGFVDQCESVEEAVRREVWEEVGLRVGEVSIVGTQPWPIGRGGSCELMIGAVAKALHDDFTVNRDEMEEAQWYSRAELQSAVQQAADVTQHPYVTNQMPDKGFFIPPPIAIAHHIIKLWTESAAVPTAKL